MSKSSTLKNLIREEILGQGPISFSRFMELALYHSEFGYYARGEALRNIGKKGDFFTSVSVGNLFGKLIAHEFCLWWNQMGKPENFNIVECGGFDGRLALDILSALQEEFPDCFKSVQYYLIEPLPHLAEEQKKNLGALKNVHWKSSLNEMDSMEGIIFGNELLDAFPVHVLENQSGEWEELFVKSDVAAVYDHRSEENGDHRPPLQNKFIWEKMPASHELKQNLPSNYRGRIEVCPAASDWIQIAASKLRKGKILLIDYGYTDEEYFQVSRLEGTLRGYRNHQPVKDVLENPGEQDLTYHVRWTPLIEKGKSAGLEVNEFIQQSRWLTGILAREKMELKSSEVRQFQTLAHPEVLGAPFRVLVFDRK
jgi:SAM-dependent MidA family methyltransferase